VAGLIFTPDGRRVAVATDEGTIRFWDTDVEAAARRVCELAGTPMTREEWSARFRDRDYRPPC
jgi:WD40 repeat protein